MSGGGVVAPPPRRRPASLRVERSIKRHGGPRSSCNRSRLVFYNDGTTMQRLLSILQSANAETDFRFQTDRPLYAGELEINFPIRCLKRNSPTARQDLRVSLSVEGRRIFGEALDLYPSARTKWCTKTSRNG